MPLRGHRPWKNHLRDFCTPRRRRSSSAPAVLFGAGTPAAKRLLGSLDPWLLAGLLYLSSGVGLLITRSVLKILKVESGETPLRAADGRWLAAATGVGGLAAPALLMAGLARTEPATASLLLNLETVFTAVLAWSVFKEPFNGRVLVGGLLVAAGSLVVSWSGKPGMAHWLGPILIAGAGLGWAVDNNLTRKIAAGDALQIAMIKCLVAGTTNTALALSFGRHLPGSGALAAAAAIGYVGYGVSLLFFILALRHIGAARTGAVFAVAPFAGAVISILSGAESPSRRLALAGGLLTAGAWCFFAERPEER
jgi:drug/metabolite transporter (DMT)-like permease